MIYEIRDLSFAYRTSQKLVLDQVNLQIEEGEIISILGRNGAGKSTLFGCMMGLKKAQGGEIRILGQDIKTMNERQIAQVVGFVPQSHTPTFAYSVFQFVLMGCASKIKFLSSPGEKEKRAAEEAIEEMGIGHLAKRPYTELSGGERQQATIARAIVSRPKIILFDEPTAHLDFCNQVKVLRVIKKLSQSGFAVAITSHDPNHPLLLGGKTAMLDADGHLIFGATEEIMTQSNLQKIYGSDLCMRRMEEFGRNVCVFPNL